MSSVEGVEIAGIAFGVPVRVTVDPSLSQALEDRLPPGFVTAPVPPSARSWGVWSAPELEVSLGELELHVAEHAEGLIFIHAGVVSFDGRAILVPGRSLAGKSTLVEALVRAGGTYYSDEFALLDSSSGVLPYPRALALRSSADSPARRIPASSMGPLPTGAVTVGLVAHLRFDVALGWDVTALGPARTALALIDNAVAAQSRTAEVLARCGAAAESAIGMTGTRGDADDAAHLLIEALG